MKDTINIDGVEYVREEWLDWHVECNPNNNMIIIADWYKVYRRKEEQPRLKPFPRAEKWWEFYTILFDWEDYEYHIEENEDWHWVDDSHYDIWNYYLSRQHAKAELDLRKHIVKMGVILHKECLIYDFWYAWEDYKPTWNESRNPGISNTLTFATILSWFAMPINSTPEELEERKEILERLMKFYK